MRMFLAAYVDSASRAKLVDLQRRLNAPGYRMIPPDNLHVTLRFLGEVDERGRSRMATLLSGIEGMPAYCDATVERFVGLPTAERPRVLALRLDTMGVLERLAEAVNRRLAPDFGPPDRPFIPHVSLARVAWRARPLAAVPPIPKAVSVRLVDFGAYRSELLSGGARYTRLMPMG